MKIPDSIVPAPLRKPAKPGRAATARARHPPTSRPLRPSARPTLSALTDQAKDAPADALAWVDQRTGASGFLTGMLYRKVPKGTNWFYTLGSATLFAFIVQAVTGRLPGDVLHALGDPGLRLDLPHQQRRLPRSVRARDAQVGRQRDGDPRSSCTWAAPSSSAPTSTRAS